MPREATRIGVDHDLLIRVSEQLNALVKKIDEMNATFHERLRDLDNSYATLESRFVQLTKYEADQRAVQDQIERHDRIFRYVSTTAVGAIVLAIMGLILK